MRRFVDPRKPSDRTHLMTTNDTQAPRVAPSSTEESLNYEDKAEQVVHIPRRGGASWLAEDRERRKKYIQKLQQRDGKKLAALNRRRGHLSLGRAYDSEDDYGGIVFYSIHPPRELSLVSIMKSLKFHGCPDVTNRFMEQNVTDFPVSYGGFGNIYLATFEDETRVGLKCLRVQVTSTVEGREYLQRAAHELYVWSKCSHPNILSLFGFAVYRDQLAMVSPWMERGNLSALLLNQPDLDWHKMCLQLADAVVYLHSEEVNIVHGDIKGANVMVSEDYTLKLADFGNSILGEYNSPEFAADPGGLGTSLRWAAPELLDEDNQLTQASDVYALGMTFLEIVTGLPPYEGVRDMIVITKIMSGVFPERPLESIPDNEEGDRFWQLLKDCWSTEADKRPHAKEARDRVRVCWEPEDTGRRGDYRFAGMTYDGTPSFTIDRTRPSDLSQPMFVRD